MAFIGSLFSNKKGAGFEAKAADIKNPVSNFQTSSANQLAGSGVNQQQAFVNALNGGVSPALQAQHALLGNLQQQAQGLGPNPALAQLNQATGQNIAGQAALMASQRGAGANAGLLARQAALQGGNIQQQAVGQAATMQANQQLAAQNALGQQAQNMIGNQAGALQGYNQAAQSEQANLLGAQNAFNQAQVSNQASTNSANAGIAAQNAKSQGGILGGVLGGIGSAIGLAEGGVVPDPMSAKPRSAVGQFLYGSAPVPQMSANANMMAGAAPGQAMDPMAQAGQMVGRAGGALLSKGISAIGSLFQPSAGNLAGAGESMIPSGVMTASQGGAVPGQAPRPGNSYDNDIVPAKLSPGEVVIPRSVMSSKNPGEAAKRFVEQVMAGKHKVAS